jgi:hypothetical protein
MHLASTTSGAASCLLASLSSFIVDYLTRARTEKGSMTYFILKQVPVLPPSAFAGTCPWDKRSTLSEWMTPRVLELTYTSWHLSAFGRDFGYPAPFKWDEERRSLLRAELDAAVFHLYGVESVSAEYILDSFYLVRDDEQRRYGEYLSRRLILDGLSRMTEAQASGIPFVSSLEPGPGDPSLAHVAAGAQ